MRGRVRTNHRNGDWPIPNQGNIPAYQRTAASGRRPTYSRRSVHAAAECFHVVEEELVRARDFSLIEHASEDEAALVEVCARGGAVEFIDVDEERRFRGGGRDFGAKAPVAPSCSTRELCLSARVASNFSERYRLCTAAETCWRSSALVRASRTSAIITSAISSAHLGWVQRAVPAYQAAIAAIAARRSRHGNGYCR